MVFRFALTSRKFQEQDVHMLMIWTDLMEGPGIARFTDALTVSVRLYCALTVGNLGK